MHKMAEQLRRYDNVEKDQCSFVVLLVLIIAASAAFAETPTAREIRMLLRLVLLKITAARPDRMSFLMEKTRAKPGRKQHRRTRKTPPMRVRQKIRTQHFGVPSKSSGCGCACGQRAVHRDHNQAGKHRGEDVHLWKEFEITGITEYTDVEIKVARLNGETGAYEIIELSDGDEVINAGAGAFSKILELEYGETTCRS